MKKGISPVIATVILVAVALVLAVALAGWVMGIWGGLGSTEALQITGHIDSSGEVRVHVINKGTSVANIIEAVFIDDTGERVDLTVDDNLQSIAPGERVDGTLTGSFTVTVGRTYVVRFYTSSGNVYEVPMKCIK